MRIIRTKSATLGQVSHNGRPPITRRDRRPRGRPAGGTGTSRRSVARADCGPGVEPTAGTGCVAIVATFLGQDVLHLTRQPLNGVTSGAVRSPLPSPMRPSNCGATVARDAHRIGLNPIARRVCVWTPPGQASGQSPPSRHAPWAALPVALSWSPSSQCSCAWIVALAVSKRGLTCDGLYEFDATSPPSFAVTPASATSIAPHSPVVGTAVAPFSDWTNAFV